MFNAFKHSGTKVVFSCKDGAVEDKAYAKRYLRVGETYTVRHIEMGAWSTSVFLEEVPKVSFNSVLFDGLEHIYDDWDGGHDESL